MTPRIFFAHPFAVGDVFALPPAQSRHLQVLRLQPGGRLALFNDEDGLEWQAEITRIGRVEVELRIVGFAHVAHELPLEVTLALGVPANERMDPLVEKATELGAAAIQPLLCERSVVRLAGDRAEARRLHWRAVAASASEQCGRVRVPRIAAPARLETWLRGLDGDPRSAAAARVLLSLAAGAMRPDDLPASFFASPSLLILSGPEGGLAPPEEAAAAAAGFLRVSLGPRVLRADTAPLAVLAWLGLSAATRRP